MEKKTALVVGATGLIGKELVKLLLESSQYDRVEVLVRREIGIEHNKLHQHIVDFDHLHDMEFKQPIHDVFCCLGTTIKKAKTKEQFQKVDLEYPIKVAKYTQKFGAKHVLVVSAIGADPQSSIFYNQVKGRLEEGLIALQLPRLSIFRPSILLGNREEFRLGERVGIAAVKLLKPILRGKLEKYRGIEAAQMANAMILIAGREDGNPVHIFESNEIEKIR